MPRATESSLSSSPRARKRQLAPSPSRRLPEPIRWSCLAAFGAWSLELRGCPAPELCRAQPLALPVRRPFPFPLAGRVARNRIAVWELIHSPHAQTPCHGPRFAANSTPSGTRSREGKEGQELGVRCLALPRPEACSLSLSTSRTGDEAAMRRALSGGQNGSARSWSSRHSNGEVWFTISVRMRTRHSHTEGSC